MHIDEDKKREILISAQHLALLNDLLVEQCDRWLSEEEGLKNMEKSIRERDKAQREGKRQKKCIIKN